MIVQVDVFNFIMCIVWGVAVVFNFLTLRLGFEMGKTVKDQLLIVFMFILNTGLALYNMVKAFQH